MKPTCFVSSPMGFAESTKYWYDRVLLPLLSKHVIVLNPWEAEVSHILAAKLPDRSAMWLDLGDYHYETIKNKAKLVVAVLDQEPPDVGTVAEVAWAAAHNIPIIGYRGDVRVSGEEGNKYNLMIGAAIRRSGGVAVSNLEELESELKRLITRYNKQQ